MPAAINGGDGVDGVIVAQIRTENKRAGERAAIKPPIRAWFYKYISIELNARRAPSARGARDRGNADDDDGFVHM